MIIWRKWDQLHFRESQTPKKKKLSTTKNFIEEIQKSFRNFSLVPFEFKKKTVIIKTQFL